MHTGGNSHWQERAAGFIRPRTVAPLVKLCSRGLHNLYITGTRTRRQTIKGVTYTGGQCRLCANESSRISMKKRRVA